MSGLCTARDRLFLGLDGGGTRTRALLANGEGVVLGYGQGGPANLSVYPLATVEESLRRAVSAACGVPVGAAQAPCPAREASIEWVVAGLAGAETPETAARYTTLLSALGLRQVRVATDAEIALAGGLAESSLGTGAVLIAGTGSVAYARDAAGRMHRAGGWGFLLGDEGGAAWIGREAAAVAIKALEGRGPRTDLMGAVPSALGLAGLNEVKESAVKGEITPARLGNVARAVVRTAQDGDPVASGLVQRAAHELALLVRSLWAESGAPEGPFRVVKAGGLFAAKSGFEDWVAKSLDELAIPAILIDPVMNPVQGAALLALDQAGLATKTAIERLRAWRTPSCALLDGGE